MNPQPDSTPTASRGASEMTAIDRAALIEKAAVAVGGASARTDGIHADRRRDAVDTALPVFADGLLAPLRELHRGEWDCGNPQHTNPDYHCPECEVWCESCGTPFPCPTVRLLDQIEADCKGGE